MTIRMGPILAFQGCTDEHWRVSTLVVADAKPGNLALTGGRADETVQPESVWTVGKQTAYRYRLAIPRSKKGAKVKYRIGSTERTISVPAVGAAPRMAYTSCNGFSSLKAMKGVKDKNRLWKEMGNKHKKAPYHLLLQGGDQVYADSMWETVPSMKDWNELSWEDGNKAPFTAKMRQALEEFYFNLYTSRWAQPEVANMLAQVPGVRMWDDHDLIDGWGSYPENRQTCAVFRGIGAAATKAFTVFQMQLGPNESRSKSYGFIAPDQGFSLACQVGPVAILAIDMRSERSERQVLSAEHWQKLYAWLDRLPDRLSHLVVLSSIPVVYPGFDTLERLLGALPGQWELEDDLRDHWRSRPHKGERLRLVHRLLAAAQEKKVRPTIISGDVHVAALGIIETERYRVNGQPVVINQLISSAIVHPGPPAAFLFALRHLFDSDDEIDRGIVGRMMEFANGPKFIGQRNFLSLEPDEPGGPGRIWANWVVEGEEDDPPTKVVHPFEGDRAAA